MSRGIDQGVQESLANREVMCVLTILTYSQLHIFACEVKSPQKGTFLVIYVNDMILTTFK